MPANTQESRIILAIEAVRSIKRMSLRVAAKTYGVSESSLHYRIKGRIAKHKKRNTTHNLTESEEETLVRYILDLDSRGFPPRIEKVKDIADLFFIMRGAKCVGKQ
jgi:hypothetical protein